MAQRGGVTLKVSGTKGIIANMYAADRRIGTDVRRLNRRAAKDLVGLARQLAPKDTENLADSITSSESDQGLVFDVFHDPSFFPGDPYHIYQELGFRHWLSGEFIQNPHLYPAWAALKPYYAADVSRAVQRALSRLRG